MKQLSKLNHRYTATIVTETFSREKILPNETPEKQYEFATSFLKVRFTETFRGSLYESRSQSSEAMLNIGMRKHLE